MGHAATKEQHTEAPKEQRTEAAQAQQGLDSKPAFESFLLLPLDLRARVLSKLVQVLPIRTSSTCTLQQGIVHLSCQPVMSTALISTHCDNEEEQKHSLDDP